MLFRLLADKIDSVFCKKSYIFEKKRLRNQKLTDSWWFFYGFFARMKEQMGQALRILRLCSL
jgi:hypothetical protein